MMADYVDLLIQNDDVVLDGAGEPQLIYDKDCITQDIKHMIRDSGLLVEMIGQRDSSKVEGKMLELVLFIEKDERLIPGTVEITRTDTETFFITATTYKYGNTSIEVTS